MGPVKARRSVGRVPAAVGIGAAAALLVTLPAAGSVLPVTTDNVALGTDAAVLTMPTDPLAGVGAGPDLTVAIERTSQRSARLQARREAAQRAKYKRIPTSNYTITATFGQPGGWSSGYHTGMDFAAPVGTPVVAAMAGTVLSVGWDGAYGNAITIGNIDGTQSRYAHLNSTSVTAGQKVAVGEGIGTVGSTGNTSGAHLHFEVGHGDGWEGGTFMDPWAWLNN